MNGLRMSPTKSSPTDSKSGGRLRGRGLSLCLAIALSACGGIPELTEPVGDPMLPDLVPDPPVDLRVSQHEDGMLEVRFSSTLVNVGEGDFVLRASRESAESHDWMVEQEVAFSEEGGDLRPTSAQLHWGGDGHDHWHVTRVASYTLYRLDTNGDVVENDIALPDAKVGFCFFDHSRIGEAASGEGTYTVEACGEEDDAEIRVGMSPGWADVYGFDLPGQSIDITDLEDGAYRLIAVADPEGWFSESDVANNVTWIDFELLTVDGDRFAQLTEVGPRPAQTG